jgi:predicted nucleic acid-binding protein
MTSAKTTPIESDAGIAGCECTDRAARQRSFTSFHSLFLVRQACEAGLVIVSDNAEWVCPDHVAPKVSQSCYPNPLSVRAVVERLAGASQSTLHQFWPDDLSLLDSAVLDPGRIHGPRQITDLYLLALAVKNRGSFVTLDRLIPADAVKGAAKDHLIML